MVRDQRHEALSALVDTLAGLTGTFNKGRTAMVRDSAAGLEWTAHVLLRGLADLGPVRASSVAECLHLDKSTVSRQVAELVRDGLLERQSDPADGRASILVPTAAGREVIADHEHHRLDFFDRMLVDWSDDEVAGFEQMLSRFAADFDQAYDIWAAERRHLSLASPAPAGEPMPASEGAAR